MRVLSVVTLFTPDGAYGGPTTVALDQAKALRAAGHDVILAGSATGYGTIPDSVGGQPVRLFRAVRAVPGAGFAGLASPGLARWLRRAVRGADVVHVHLARDLVTLPAARLAQRAGVPYVVQTHGMIDATDRLLARPLDAVLTRPALRGASAILHLTARERRDLAGVAGEGLPFVELPNGVEPQVPAPSADPPEVLYLARLAARKRPTTFVAAAQRLARRHPTVRFTLVGPDEGEGDAVRGLLATDDAGGRISWNGPLPIELARQRAATAAVSVLPSVDEPFPMSALEAMARGVPVVVTESCGLASRVRQWGAGAVVGTSVDDLVAGIDALLDPARRADAGAAAHALCTTELSLERVADGLAAVYGKVRVTRPDVAHAARARRAS